MIYTDSQTLIQLPKPTILCHIEWQKGREKKKKKKGQNVLWESNKR